MKSGLRQACVFLWAGVAASFAADPFAGPDASGFDASAPTASAFAASLPALDRAAGAEVTIEFKETRESPDDASASGDPADVGRIIFALPAKLHEVAWSDAREFLKTNPAGKSLDPVRWTGRVIGARAETTESPGCYTVEVFFAEAALVGWTGGASDAEPILTSRSLRTGLTVNNRWVRIGGVSRITEVDGAETRAKTALYLRVADGLPPAAEPVRIAEPSSVAITP